MTAWLHRINAIAPIAENAAVNALWTIIAPNGDPEAATFGAPLSANGEEPATHTGISTAATEEVRLLIVATYADELSTAVFDIHPAVDANDWSGFIAANGLQRIEKNVTIETSTN